MSLHEHVRVAILRHTQELHVLLEFVRDVDTYMVPKARRRVLYMRDTMPANVLAEMQRMSAELMEVFEEADRIRKESPSGTGKKTVLKFKGDYSREADESFLRFAVAALKPIRYPTLLYSLALTHAIAVFEYFLSDFLIAIFTHRPNTLKSQSTATYENIVSFGSMKELIRYLATAKVKKILEGNIDEVVDKLKNDFNFDVAAFRQFNILREASYRRNIVVHNKGITDKAYCEKIQGSQIGVTLSMDFRYIETLTTVIGRFIDHLDNHFSRKMHYMRHPMENKILHPPPS
jgi:hypothetical protein